MGRPKGSKNKAQDDPDDDHAGEGSNVKISKRQAKEYSGEYNQLLDDLESYRGEIMSKCKELIEKAANETGLKRSVVREGLADHRKYEKLKAKLKEMEPDEKTQRANLRAALGLYADTPLGQAAVAANEDE